MLAVGWCVGALDNTRGFDIRVAFEFPVSATAVTRGLSGNVGRPFQASSISWERLQPWEQPPGIQYPS
jgi:hypothetical protein